MAFDEALAQRIREQLLRRKNITEKKMFGICFLLKGNILVGVWKESLIARIGPDAYEDALLDPDVKEFDITGKAMTGWVVVKPAGIADEEQMSDWFHPLRPVPHLRAGN